jgi:hypothetical protein
MATTAASCCPSSAAFCPPILRDRYFCHLSLLPLVTWTEYSCKTLHEIGRAVSENTLLLGSSVNRGNGSPL